MKKKLKNLIQNVKLRQPRALIIAIILVLLVVAGGVSAFYIVNKGSSANSAKNDSASRNNLSENDLTVAVVGEEESLITENAASNNSWPGEIISLSNLQVQPDREGTISEWFVHIGERVNTGQIIGKLSRPPQTPDAIMALSEKSQMLSEARTSVEALRTYTAKRISQLRQLRSDTESSNKQKIDLLRSDMPENNNALLSLIASKKKLAEVILRGSISKTFPMVSTQSIIPSPGSSVAIQLKWAFGALDTSLRNTFPNILIKVLSDLKDTNIVPEKSGLLYFDTAIKLANVSVADDEALPEASLESLKQMLFEDQSEFVTVLGEIKSMELEKANIQRESIDTLAEIDAMIAELEKEFAMSEGEFIAKETAYAIIKESVSGGYSIVAPNSGIVSSIMKKPGEFVGPGMPVATITAKNSDRTLIRMRIPNNIQKPKTGELLSIVRPGFGTIVQKARLIGVASSLDDNDGSYMADAVFTETTKWPIGASVRILAPASSSAALIKYSSVLWNDEGIPYVWVASEAGRIFAQKITIGRTLGAEAEVYTGLKNGDRYIVNPTPDIKEDMFLDDFIKTTIPAESGEDKGMGGGMQM